MATIRHGMMFFSRCPLEFAPRLVSHRSQRVVRMDQVTRHTGLFSTAFLLIAFA